jgi:diguanylate cyclase (GGDEF)-like protein
MKEHTPLHPMNAELPFTGFNEHIQIPLASSDKRSFALIKRIFIEHQQAPMQPFTVLILKLTGNTLPENEALICWRQIIKHKVQLQQKLGRTVGIQTAAIDYFEYVSPTEICFSQSKNSIDKIAPPISEPDKNQPVPDYRLEKLKEEILRAKRYKHALSVIMVDIDNFHTINDKLGFQNGDHVLSTIVQIIKKIIRNVDFLSRLSGDRFLLILPNTNLREAQELAERIRIQIFERTSRLKNLSEGITATLSVGQCTNNDTSIDFIHRLEHVLDEGRHKNRNTVYPCN